MHQLQGTLDQLDLEIIARLRRDALTTNKAMALELGVAESTIGTRIRSLSERNIMRVVAIHDVRALGCELLAHADLYIEGRDAAEVAAELAGNNLFSMVCTTAGSPQIIVQVNGKDRTHLVNAFLQCGRVRGVAEIRSMVALRIMKYESEFTANLENHGSDIGELEGRDEIETRILRIVARDARTGNREIGRMLGVSEALVRKRLKALVVAGAIRFGAMLDARALGLNCSAFIRVSVEPNRVLAVAARLMKMGEINFVSLISGEYNLMLVCTVPDRDALATLANGHIGVLDGVRRIDLREISDVARSDFNIVRITPAGFDGLVDQGEFQPG